MKIYTLRLKPDEDLKSALLSYAKEQGIKAGSILTCVGSLKEASLRMAGALPDKQDTRIYKDIYEIVSLTGTLNHDDCHLHLAISDKEGKVYGGHLKNGSLIETTAEIVIIEDDSVVYTRELDEVTGFMELKTTKRKQKTS